MSDNSGTAAQPGAASGNPAAQPGQQASNFVQVDPQEYQRLQRSAQQAEGMRAFYDRARQHGFDKPEAFDAYGKAIGALNKRGVKLETLATAFDDPEPQHRDFDPDKFGSELESKILEKAVAKAEEKIRHADSMRDHKQGIEAMNRAIDEYVGKTLPKDATEYEKESFAAYVRNQVDKNRRSDSFMYAEDHPLRSYDWQPLSGDKLTPIFDTVKKAREKHAGAMAAAKGAAVNSSASAAGNSAGQGAPTTNPTSTLPLSKRPKSEQEAYFKQKMESKRSAGGAVSSVAG